MGSNSCTYVHTFYVNTPLPPPKEMDRGQHHHEIQQVPEPGKIHIILLHLNSCQQMWMAVLIVHLWHQENKHLSNLQIGFLCLIQKGASVLGQLPVRTNLRLDQTWRQATLRGRRALQASTTVNSSKYLIFTQ